MPVNALSVVCLDGHLCNVSISHSLNVFGIEFKYLHRPQHGSQLPTTPRSAVKYLELKAFFATAECWPEL